MTHTDTIPRLRTAAELSARLHGVSRQRLYQLAAAGQIPHVKLGRAIRFADSAIVEWVRNGGTAAAMKAAEEGRTA